MIIAAGFSLLKLMNSFFARHINIEYGRNLFNRTIQAIRIISVFPNDLPNRLAEVLAQLWRSSGAGSRLSVATSDSPDSSLQLKVKCRMSMSLVFDSVWRWREEFQAQGRGNLECNIHPVSPTHPQSKYRQKRTNTPNKPRSKTQPTPTPPSNPPPLPSQTTVSPPRPSSAAPSPHPMASAANQTTKSLTR